MGSPEGKKLWAKEGGRRRWLSTISGEGVEFRKVRSRNPTKEKIE